MPRVPGIGIGTRAKARAKARGRVKDKEKGRIPTKGKTAKVRNKESENRRHLLATGQTFAGRHSETLALPNLLSLLLRSRLRKKLKVKVWRRSPILERKLWVLTQCG